MGKIVLLDEITSNQIAAGEVVERPSSVAKELIENSLDAGATSITVEIENGGISYLRVTDNGSGIAKDDITIAFERHATSKIRTAKDLESILSFGFRGEALASIASVSQVELTSKIQADDTGNKVIIKGGHFVSSDETACTTGTSIVVKDLFFNTPARYKFLKKDYTEAGYVEDIISHMALINPNVAFKFINTKKVILQTAGTGDILTCVHNIYGKEISKFVIEFNQTIDDIAVEGVTGKADISRSNRSNEIFFVNGRFIKNKTITSALENAYQTIIPAGKFPFSIINIKVSPSFVDVNVHPTKTEVRFSDENVIYRAVYNTIKDAVLKRDLIPEVKLVESSLNKSFRFSNKPSPSYLNEQHNDFFTTPLYNNEMKEKKEPYDIKERNATLFVNNNNIMKIEQKNYKILGIAFSTYIIIEQFDNIYIIDQHAAHERVMYEKLLKKIKEGRSNKQILMIPEVINVKNNEWNLIQDNVELFDKAGFEIEEFGTGTVKISAVPGEIVGVPIKEVFLDILDSLQKESGAKEERAEYFIFTMACKAAVKANMKLDILEVESLIDEMMKLENPFTCPHGRPTAIKITKDELEKKFRRT